MKRVVISFLVIFVLLFGTALIAPGFVDWNKYKNQIVSQINSASGYEINVAGDLELALIPYPRLMIEKVSVSSPAAKNQEPFIALERIDVSVALWPLLSKDIEVTKVRLLAPVLTLVVADDGTASWLTEKPAEENNRQQGAVDAQGTDFLESVKFEEIVIDKGSLTYRDDTKKHAVTLDHIEMSINAGTLYGPFVIDGSASYQGNNISADIKTERIVKGAKSFPVNAHVSLPSSGSELSYAGVVDFEKGIELQGETSLKTQDLAKLASVSGVSLPPSLAKAFSVQGLFTFTPDMLSSKSLKLSLADTMATGRFEIAGIADKSAPVDISASLSVRALAVDDFITPHAQRPLSGAGTGHGSFLPETITLPRAVKGNIAVKAETMTYKGTPFRSVDFSANIEGNKTSWQFAAAAPSESTFDLKGTVNFASSSLSQKSGATTYSDPVLVTDITIKGNDALSLYNMAGTNIKIPAAYKGLIDKKALSLKSAVTVSAMQIKTGESSLRLDGDLAVFDISYKKGQGATRDHLSLKATASSINADRWLDDISKNDKPGKEKPSPYEMVQSFDLPFDLKLDITLPGLQAKGKSLESFSANIDKTGDKLRIEKIGLQDNSGNNLQLSGTMNDIKNLNGIDLLLSGKTKNAEPVLEFAGLDISNLPAIGSAEMLAEFKGHADDLAFTANVAALRGTIEATGAITDLTKTPVLGDLSLRLKHPNYVQLVNMIKPGFKSAVTISKNLDLFASIAQKEGVYRFSDIKAMVGPTAIAGMVAADMTGTKPKVTGQIQFGDVPLSDLLGHEKPSHKASATGKSTQDTQDVRWSREPIDASVLHAFDADLQISAKSFTYGTWTVSGLALEILIENGRMTVEKMDGNLYGGRVSLNGDVTAPEKKGLPLAIKGKVDARDVDIESFVQSFSGRKLINAKGTIFFDADVSLTGASPAALIFDLNGTGGADGVNLVIEGFDLARLSRTLAQPSSSMTENLGSLLNSTMNSGSTEFETLHSRYTIKNGVINFDALELKGPEAVVTGTGHINLPVWSINLETEVDLAAPEDAPSLRTVFKGPLDNPVSTFGKSALDSWFQTQFGNMIERSIIDKLEKQGIIRAKPLEQPAPQTQGQSDTKTEGSGTTTDQPDPSAQETAPKKTRPEDVFFNIIQDALQ